MKKYRNCIALVLVLCLVCMGLPAISLGNAQADGERLSVIIGTTALPMVSPCGLLETEVMQYVMEKENLDITLQYYDGEKWNLMFASLDFPDVVNGNLATHITSILDSGLALNLDDYIDQYAPSAKLDIYETSFNLIRQFKSNGDGHLYFIPPRIGLELPYGGTDIGRGYSVRWDYYKELGCPVIASDDDFLDVVEQMVAAHPETENGKKVYAFGLTADFNTWYERACFVKPALLDPWAYGGTLYMSGFDDNVLYDGYLDIERSPYWTDMAFYREAYKRGLLDPDSFTQSSDQLSEKFRGGQIVASTAWTDSSLYSVEKEKDPDTLAGIIRVPSPNALFFADNPMLFGDFPIQGTFVPFNTSNIEGAMRVIEILCNPDYTRIFYSGIEGKHWNYVDGVPTLTDEIIVARRNDTEDFRRTGINNFLGVFRSALIGSFELADGYPADLIQSKESLSAGLTPLQADLSAYYGVSYPSEASAKYVESGDTIDLSNHWMDIAGCLEIMPSDITRILEKCNDILYKAIPKLIMAETEDEYEAVKAQVLADLAGVNEQEAWAWAEANFNAAKAAFSEYASSISWLD